ncbi:5-bromo-4-chloroindolyl phosphate hydrolysis protein [Pedobacter cryoconitis]|uniref:5-bromo-4-chloroindolyl phosphate hydrolysis protein n=1 Tax=Pedobacter cryoconitis TaxID=188932 RepID=A0A7W8ZJ80_9SPHI|nr:5-bromo-4-chloroindolyl phosphate hydrolysis protein [Pedobacter cryoconitis]MBB6271772.1 5-bromo-4-chloroindolyl phosphate hydrolysis protein [Pedobacter cryoconitis]
MKTLLLFIIINTNFSATKTVYICNSGISKKYHYKQDCRGLKNCQFKLLKINLDKAKREGRTLCKWER